MFLQLEKKTSVHQSHEVSLLENILKLKIQIKSDFDCLAFIKALGQNLQNNVGK